MTPADNNATVSETNAKELELSLLKAEWVELPVAGSGHWFLHIAVTHGNDKVTKLWLTGNQAEEVAQQVLSRKNRS